jgi:organic radical activating enzyme
MEKTTPELTAGIVEIFKSYEGEGVFIGTPTIFIRLAGCNVGCKFCDSKQTWNEKKFPQMTVKSVVDEVIKLNSSGCKVARISITGGEPLLHEEFFLNLCDALLLCNHFFVINVETSGTLFPESLFGPGNSTDYVDQISLDIKTPSSGVILTLAQLVELQRASEKKNVYVKAVIATTKDLDFVLDFFKDTKVNNLTLTPCEKKGKFYSVDSIYKVLDKRKINLGTNSIRVIAQQHKLLSFR